MDTQLFRSNVNIEENLAIREHHQAQKHVEDDRPFE